jgi:PAS domain-containing protein
MISDIMKRESKTNPQTNSQTKPQLLLEVEELRTRIDSTERRLQEASELLQVQIAERKRVEESFEDARKYTESIVETIREPLVVLTSDLKVISANRSFYETFQVTPEETGRKFIFNIGNHQWDIHALGEEKCFSTLVGSIGKAKARTGYSSLLTTSPIKSRWRRRSRVLKCDTAASLKQLKMEY